jgi:hypothetical protein
MITMRVYPFCFSLGETVVPSFTGADKGPVGMDLRLSEPLIDVEDIVAHESGMMNVTLASGRERAIDCDIVCGLLAQCLQDVRFSILVTLYLFALLLSYGFSLLFVLGYDID